MKPNSRGVCHGPIAASTRKRSVVEISVAEGERVADLEPSDRWSRRRWASISPRRSDGLRRRQFSNQPIFVVLDCSIEPQERLVEIDVLDNHRRVVRDVTM